MVAGYAAYRYAYKPHTATEDRKVEYSGSTADFQASVSQDENAFLDKAVELSGPITSVSATDIVLGGSIYCQFEQGAVPSGLAKGSTAKIRGRYIGYDELLEEVKLDKCIVVE